MDQKIVLTKAELARKLGVCTRTVDYLRRRGLPAIVLGRRLIRFHLEDVLQWLRQNGTNRMRSLLLQPQQQPTIEAGHERG